MPACNNSSKKIKVSYNEQFDDGVDLDCLNKGKIWKNEGEIPDNNIDDDNNGYVDDIHGYNFVHNSGNVSSDTDGYHGNYISSILIGYNQKLGYKGLLNDYNVEVIILKVLNGEESIGNIRDIKRAIDYAEMVGADICNMSLDYYNYDTELKNKMNDSNMLFVVPMGNDGKEITENNKVYPACYELDNIMAVCDIRSDGRISKTSNYSSRYADIAAPGTDIIGAYDKDNLISLSGTSSATAIMTSEMAISSIYYDLEMSKIKDFICSNVRQVNNLSGKCRTSGYFSFKSR